MVQLPRAFASLAFSSIILFTSFILFLPLCIFVMQRRDLLGYNTNQERHYGSGKHEGAHVGKTPLRE